MARTAGDVRGWALVGFLGLIAVTQPWGCNKDDDTGPGPTEEALSELLADTWPFVLEPALSAAHADAVALVGATEAWAAAERAGTGEAEARAAAQEAWRAAMASWQEVEVMQIGPAGSSLTAVGGQDLRDEAYSWPTTNPCRVDQETVAAEWGTAGWFEAELVNVYGLDALETLLFSEPNVNACPAQVDINTSGSWAALGEDGVQQNRADYAVAVATHYAETVATIAAAWDPEQGDFAGTFAAASSPYEGQTQALNAVFDALYYLETRTTDRKLGGPLGLRDCGQDDCLPFVETRTAGGSNVWIAQNLVGFRSLFTAGEGTGMEDLLRSLGHDAVADDMLGRLDRADAAAAALTIPVDEAATTDPTAALALHAALIEVTDLLETDVATILAMQIPAEADGDND
jgi:predicted lipoprotein